MDTGGGNFHFSMRVVWKVEKWQAMLSVCSLGVERERGRGRGGEVWWPVCSLETNTAPHRRGLSHSQPTQKSPSAHDFYSYLQRASRAYRAETSTTSTNITSSDIPDMTVLSNKTGQVLRCGVRSASYCKLWLCRGLSSVTHIHSTYYLVLHCWQ